MVQDLMSACQRAAEIVRSLPPSSRIRVVSHYDADGISAAGVLCTALYRAGYEFHATLMRNPFTKGFDRLKSEQNGLIVFADMGSGQLATIQELGCQAIILDHHQYQTTETTKHVLQINCNSFGVDGNYEACGATLSYLLATALNPTNEDLAPLALAGATGDKQYIGGFRGVNKTILDAALKNGLLCEETSIKLYGASVGDALLYSIDPYYPGLSGNQQAIEAVLEKLQVDTAARLEDIDHKAMMRLQSLLVFRLLKAGCPTTVIDMMLRKRYLSVAGGFALERFADLLDACGKNGHRSLGLALCLGNTDAWAEAVSVEKDYKQQILDGLRSLEDGGIHETEVMRYFYAQNSSLGGVIAGIAVNYVCDEKKPLFSLVRKQADDEVHVSCRGNQKLVAQGLDLGSAMKQVATELGGHGGGHKIAAGATIGLNQEQEFLTKVDDLLQQQMRGTP
ncbi:MAG: DHH family phosphoesterase [Candidatus Thermoplasmatota archaeon]|nr:DHH family phosphoesterase [Candidatus Thermoplasmatota archaeon]